MTCTIAYSTDHPGRYRHQVSGQMSEVLTRGQLRGARGSRRFASRPLAPPPSPANSSNDLAGPGRSLRLAKWEGQGVRPLHPGSLRLAHRCGGGKLAPIDQLFVGCHSGWCNRQFFGHFARSGFIRFPRFVWSHAKSRRDSRPRTNHRQAILGDSRTA